MNNRTENTQIQKYTITGTLYKNHDGDVVHEEQVVHVNAIQVGTESTLAEGLSTENGQYSFVVEWEDSAAVVGTHPKGPNIQIEVFSFMGEHLGTSEIRYHINENEDIPLIIKEPPSVSEYERLGAVLRKILPGQSITEKDIPVLLHSLKDYNKNIPGFYLATVTEKNLESWLHSENLATESGLPGSFFYGIDQVGRRPLNLQKILNKKDAVLRKRFTNSVKLGKVPKLDWGFIQKQLDELRLNVKLL